MACGLAEESGEPVVITCTGATASRNYIPGMTEAYYRKLPVLAVTSMAGRSKIGNLNPQIIDRSRIQKDVSVYSAFLPFVHDCEDERLCVLTVNKAMIALRAGGGGRCILMWRQESPRISQSWSCRTFPKLIIMNMTTNYRQSQSVTYVSSSDLIFHGKRMNRRPWRIFVTDMTRSLFVIRHRIIQDGSLRGRRLFSHRSTSILHFSDLTC